MRYCPIAFAWICLGMASVAHAAEPDAAGIEFFEKEVRPLLVEKCQECHGARPKIKGGLNLMSRAALLKGGDSGPAVVAGKPEESLLIKALQYVDPPRMPPKAKLQDREIAIFTRWVKMGAPWPATTDVKPIAAGKAFEITPEQRSFWAFQPMSKPTPPQVKDTAWPRSELDCFVLAALEKEGKGLKPAKQADRRTLIRRATFDLTGLPPTPEEIDAFLKDDSSEAFARVVDRLLASPHYGERWGRHWLDVIRYTDSFDARDNFGLGDISEAWRYRDWVVQAFNRDLPYDQFVTQQLAGDILHDPKQADWSGVVATSVLAMGNWGGGDADKEKLLTDIADDQVDLVGRAFMGLTLACARCHDHKFDPISTADYYGLAGIFFSTHILPNVGAKTAGPPMLRIPMASKEEVARREVYDKQLQGLEANLKFLREKADEQKLTPEAKASLMKLTQELDQFKKQMPAPLPFTQGAQEGGVPGSPHAGVHDVRVHVRGRYDRLGELVPRRFPVIVAGEKQTPMSKGSGRLDLARWLTSPEHPLTARVMVNRIWQGHFGQGIVRTPGNFGKLGERPTHPELLDYVARRFIGHGWSMKRLHREIMLSSAYQQSSTADAETLKADPDNRLLGRMNRRRLEAEAVRDNLLAVAGRLDRQQGGKAVRDFNNPRRTIYQMTIRSDRSGFGPLFDAADPTAIIGRRTVSTVAPQALFMLNHPFVLEQAKTIAAKARAEKPEDGQRLEALYVRLYGRRPSAEELRIGKDFLSRSGPAEKAWEEYCQILLCANEFIYVD
jgi:hypothetical protein